MKPRLLDTVLCVVALPVLLPVMALVAVATWLDSPGPVLYRSRRIGAGGRSFEMLKFRTMGHGLPGESITSACDERITPVGSWLRRHRLDELPQIVNVLRGDMRLVGPRPEVAEFVLAYPEQYALILSVRPGVTGPTQLSYADEEKLLSGALDRVTLYRETILPAKMDSDLRYVERSTIRGDLLLLCRTGLLPVRRLRVMALGRSCVRPGVAAGTRASVAFAVFISLLSLAMMGLFAVDVWSS